MSAGGELGPGAMRFAIRALRVYAKARQSVALVSGKPALAAPPVETPPGSCGRCVSTGALRTGRGNSAHACLRLASMPRFG